MVSGAARPEAAEKEAAEELEPPEGLRARRKSDFLIRVEFVFEKFLYVVALAVDEVSLDERRREVFQGDLFQIPVFQFPADEFIGQEAVSVALFEIVKEFGGVVHFQPEHIIFGKERTDKRAHVAEGEIAHQIGDMGKLFLRNAVGIPVESLAGDERQPVRIENFADEPRPFEGHGGKHDVENVVLQQLYKVERMSERHFDGGHVVAFQALVPKGPDVGFVSGVDGADGEFPGIGGHGVHLFHGGLFELDDPLRIAQENFSLFRQLHRFGAAGKQPLADFFFKLADPVGDRRLRDAHLFRRQGKIFDFR